MKSLHRSAHFLFLKVSRGVLVGGFRISISEISSFALYFMSKGKQDWEQVTVRVTAVTELSLEDNTKAICSVIMNLIAQLGTREGALSFVSALLQSGVSLPVLTLAMVSVKAGCDIGVGGAWM